MSVIPNPLREPFLAEQFMAHLQSLLFASFGQSICSTSCLGKKKLIQKNVLTELPRNSWGPMEAEARESANGDGGIRHIFFKEMGEINWI